MKLEQVIPDAVGKDPKRAASTGEETLPPPMVILGKSAWGLRFCSGSDLTSEQSWLYVVITVTSTTVTNSTTETTLRKPKT